jgi:hypothetical protein
MSFQSQDIKSVCFQIGWDPAGDDVITLWRAPKACELVRAQLTMPNAVSGSTANYFAAHLLNSGSAGTATTVMSGTIGGTAGWSALTPVTFTSVEGTLAEGDIVALSYNEEGTSTIQSGIIQLDYVLGLGA